MFEIATIVAPVFMVVLVGYIASRTKLVSNGDVDALLRFTTHFAVPALLFGSVATLDLSEALAPGLLAAYYLPAFTTFAIGIVAARRLFRQRPGEAVASGFTALFANSIFLGLPIAERAFGQEGLFYALAIVSVHIPAMYTVGVIAMETAARDGAGFIAAVRKVLRTLSRNPLFVSVVAGIAVNLLGPGLHQSVRDGLEIMSRATLPLGMFGIGATLTRYSLGGNVAVTAFYVALTLLVRPALVAIAAFGLLTLDPLAARVAVVMAAMPGGINIYLFATLYQRSQMLAANALLVGTALSVITVTATLALLG